MAKFDEIANFGRWRRDRQSSRHHVLNPMLSSSLDTTRILKEVTLGKIRVVLYDSGLKTSPFLHLEAVLNVLR